VQCLSEHPHISRDEGHLLRGSRSAIRLLQTSRLRTGAASQADERWRRVPVAADAPRSEPLRGDAEDAGQLPYFLGSESPLPALTMAFGSAHGGNGRPAHQLAEFRLRPSIAQAKSPDVRAYDGELLGRDRIDAQLRLTAVPGSARCGRHTLGR
jgi:hypothetical protein